MVSSSFRGVPRVKLLCALVASCFAAEGLANPTGPAVVAGSASFNTVGKNLTVTNTPNAIINWQGFSIGAGEATRFQQQSVSSAVLNRVVGQDPSTILGSLWSNGKVFLVNPNGVLFGQGSRIDVAGLVASTLNITDRDFLAGRLNFQAGAVAGSIVNQGEIVSASGGRIYLIAPDVQNHGLISSPSGEVVLAAGKTVSLVDADVPNLKVEVQAGGEALNVGRIIADGGKAGIYAGLINQRGIVRADSISQDATGRIVFKASDTTILDDGSVTSAAGAKGGEIHLLGNKVGLVGNARVDASGDIGGGTVLIGGDYQGTNPDVQNAYRTYVGLQSSITADAITSGDGGKVIVWADDATRAYGTISARGGAQSGNGGFVEVSGKNWLDFGATVNTGAVAGKTGVLLLDPTQVNIVAAGAGDTLGGGAGFDTVSFPPNNVFDGGGGTLSSISWTTIKDHLTGSNGGSNTNVYITTSGTTLCGGCGIDILAPSPDLQSSNTLRLISHEHITVQAGTGITNSGTGALEMYAGWDQISPPTSPVLTNGAGTITINASINFAGNVLLRAYSDIVSSAAGSITTPNLLASSLNGAVTLNSPSNMVGTLAGEFHDDFQFTNGSSLTIGTVGAVSGISTVPSPGGAPSLQLTATGNLTVNSPISATDGNGTTADTSITLNALSGGISVNNTSIFATAGVDDSADGQTGSVVLNATGGGILISNSTVAAHGGNPGSGPGGSATLSLNATGGITANSASTIIALGKAGVGTSQPGGNASLTLVGGGGIDTSSSSLNALGGAPGSGGTAGVGSVLVAVNSTSGNANPSGDIIVHNITADNVNLQQDSKGSAKSILRAFGSSLIGASQLLMEVDDTLGNVGGGSIGTAAAPMRVQVATLEAHTHYPSLGIFIDSPNVQNLQIGGVSFNSGSVKGVQALAGGDISIGVNGTLTLQSGAANSPCGVGTGGPICTTSGNVTLRAEDLVIGHSIAGTGTVALAPFTQSRQINIESSPSGGVLSLTPGEIALVSTPGTLEIGRSDGNATMVVNTALASGNVNAGALRLYSGNINLTASGGDIGSSGTPFAHNLELKANNDVQLTVGNIYLADNKSLTVIADNDASGFGNVNIGAVTMQVGNTGANTGSMTVQGRNINAIISGNGGGNLRVFGTGNQTITASGDAIFRNDNTSIGALFVQADGGLQSISASHLELTAGSGTGTLAQIVAFGGSQSITVGSGGLSLVGGGGTATGSDAMISASTGTQSITVNGGGDITLTGGSGSGTDNSARIRAQTGAQTITFNSGGDLVLVGGTVGALNLAQIVANNPTVAAQTQTITGATGIMLTGGASGGGLDGSNNSLGNFARILNANGTQSISVGAGGITLTGGGGALTSNFAGIFQGANTGSPGTSQTLTINNGGTVTLQGGSSAQTNVINNSGNLFRGSYAQIQGNGDSQQINFTSGGAINLTGGTVGSNNPAQILSRFGLQTIAGAPTITLTGGATGGYVDLALNKNEGNYARINSDAGQSITASTITLTGGAAGVGNHALIFNGSTTVAQSINATSVSLTGGAGGGIDSGSTGSAMGNYALIQSNNAAQTINAVDLALQGGAGGTENFAAITSPTQSISLSGDLSLVGGGSATGAVRGGGARIGGQGGGSPSSTNLTLLVAGDLSMTGGSVANAGTAIGSGTVGGQPTTMEIDVGGNVTLNPGTVALGSSRIGSPASNIAGGDIAITAGGTLALNSTGPGLGTAIRTLGNVTLNAASITQGADSEIIAGGVTTLATTGSISLPGANDFNQVTVGSASSVTLNDINAIVLNGVTTSGGLTVSAGGAITPGDPIVVGGSSSFNAGSNAITLTNTSNDFTGAVSLTGSSASITDANALALGTVSVGGGSLAVNTSGAITQSGPISAGAASFNAGSNPIMLTDTANDFTGVVSLTGTNVSITDANTLTLGAVSATNLTVNASTISQDSSGVVASGTSTLTAGSVSLTTATNDFGTVAVSSPGDVALTDANAITIAASSVGGTFDIVATSTSFLNGFSANNYTFSGGSYTLAAGTYNLGGTTTVAGTATVMASTATINAAGGTINVSGLLDSGTSSIAVGTLNVLAGGTLSGTGTIVGNVNNSAGTVSPGASAGILTISGNYVQGASGTLAMDIGGFSPGTGYDQLLVSGTTSLDGTLNTALIGGFVPPAGSTYTFIQAAGGVSGTFSTINQPVGALFNTFYGPTTFEFIAVGGGSVVPAPIEPSFNNAIFSIDQLFDVLLDVGGVVEFGGGGVLVSTTTTTPEGKLVPKPPACN